MIITVTLNPTIDHTVILDELIIGETNRVKESRSDPGGKGVNVSRVLRALGQSSLAMGFVAGSVGRHVEASLGEHGILDDFIHTSGQTRTNVAIFEEKRHVSTVISEKGPDTEPHFVDELKHRLKGHCQPGSWVVCAGSAPPNIGPSIYAELIALAKQCGARTALDADEELLREGLQAGPDVIKPNRVELEGLIGRPLETDGEVLQAAREIRAQGVGTVIVSMGARGSIAVAADGAWKAVPPKIKVENTVGAGDSLLAGVIYGLDNGKPLAEAIRWGTAAGAATAMTTGTQLGYRADIDRLLPEVVVEKLE